MSMPDLAAYETIVQRGRCALAWEVLRRDPAYRAAFNRLPALPRVGVASDTDFATRWGLHFR